MMFKVERLVGDSHCELIAEVADIEEAMSLADQNAYDAEPDVDIDTNDEDFSWEDYEGMGRVTDDDNDCILYWCNGDGKTGTYLTADDPLYKTVMKHMEV
jgi:hypothetical protein